MSCRLLLPVLLMVSSWMAFASVSTTCLYLPNIQLHGGTYDEFKSDTGIEACCMRCAEQSCCIAYTYDFEKKRCYLKSAIGTSEEKKGFRSGIKSNNYNGAVLKNIRMEGHRDTKINLDSKDDCLQYCTAFGMYSWMPAISEEQPAECTCMSRILSLRYFHGAQSVIFPMSDANF